MRKGFFAFGASVFLALAAGCSSQPVQHTSCYTVECLTIAARQQAADDCVNALSRAVVSKAHQAELDRVYNDPMKNNANYVAVTSAGFRATSPTEWCEAWAKMKVPRSPLAKR